MLWIPLVVAASLLYIFDIGVELRYRVAMPQITLVKKGFGP
jgi:hypothetical protein